MHPFFQLKIVTIKRKRTPSAANQNMKINSEKRETIQSIIARIKQGWNSNSKLKDSLHAKKGKLAKKILCKLKLNRAGQAKANKKIIGSSQPKSQFMWTHEGLVQKKRKSWWALEDLVEVHPQLFSDLDKPNFSSRITLKRNDLYNICLFSLHIYYIYSMASHDRKLENKTY